VRFDPSNRKTLDDIANLRVSGANVSVDLGSIADIRIGGSPSEIDRIDRSRNITLSVELNGRILNDVYSHARALPALRNLPEGVRLVEQGELQRSSELFESFGIAMAIGVFCIYAVLALLFHDFLQPLTILMALPLSLGGALLPLVMTGTSFSMPAVIGLLMLMGVVTKNSILLVEYAIMSRRAGMSRFEALVDACHKRAPGHHDHHRHGMRHAAGRFQSDGRRFKFPSIYGHRRYRRSDDIDVPEPSRYPGDLYIR
jgi:multidrug efflux pump subunit AcrB